MAFRAFIVFILLPFSACALQGMDDKDMSDVVAQDGVRLLSEYEIRVDAVQYFDDENINTPEQDGGGSVVFSSVNIATRDLQVIDFDIIKGTAANSRAGRNGIRFTSEELPIDLTVDKVAINGLSIGKVGLTDFTTGGVSPIILDLWAGGFDSDNDVNTHESGLTIDLSIPKESSFNTYYEDDGSRLSMTVDYCSGSDASGCTGGGLNLKGLTVDVVAKGLRLGIPEVEGGHINIRNFRINDSLINDITLSNITILEGGYLVLGAPDVEGESSLNIDAYIASGTSLDFQLFDTSDSDVQVAGAHIELLALGGSGDYFKAEDISMNVYSGEGRGLRFDIGDAVNNSGGIQGTLRASDITLRPVDQVTAPVLGSIQVDLQILPGSYLEIMGH
jgi:hypothetical protein